MVDPKWKTLAKDIGSQIVSGQLKPGDQLLSTSQLCKKYSVSSIVVRNAMLHLKALGIVVGVPGVGTYLTDDAVERWEEAKDRLNPE
jgi:DNA-binding GntR family transcriptional regulator